METRSVYYLALQIMTCSWPQIFSCKDMQVDAMQQGNSKSISESR